jgi:hypothetical protein
VNLIPFWDGILRRDSDEFDLDERGVHETFHFAPLAPAFSSKIIFIRNDLRRGRWLHQRLSLR